MAKKKKAAKKSGGAKRRSGGLNASLKAHAADETDYGSDMTDLPPGISQGVAQLTKAHIGQYKSGDNEGKSFVYLGASVLEPEEHTYTPKMWEDNGTRKGTTKFGKKTTVRTKGLLTSPGTLSLCEDGRGTEDENVARALNEIRKIGGEECTADVESLEDLEELLNQLLEEKPYVRFSTRASDVSKKYPEQRTWENWHGVAEYEESEDEEEPEEDEEDDEAEEDADEDDEGSEETAEDEEEASLSELAALADDEEDEEAQGKLEELAGEQDLDPDDYDSWADLAVAIEEATEGDEEEDEDEEDEDQDPEKGMIFSFRPPKSKRDATVEVITVNKRKRTCSVKEIEGGKLHRNVAWDKLEVEE